MKKFRKIMAVLVAAIMIMAMCVPAWAANDSETDTTFTITIDNALNGETYTAYKIFDTTYAADHAAVANVGYYVRVPWTEAAKEANRFITYYIGVENASVMSYTAVDTDEKRAAVRASDALYQLVETPVAYTINKNTSNWWSIVDSYSNTSANGLNKYPSVADPNVYVITIDENEFRASDFAEKLRKFLKELNNTDSTPLKSVMEASAVDADSIDGETQNGTNYGTVTLNVSDSVKGGPGYYFVDTSLGSLIALDTTLPSVIVKEKNVAPTNTKEVYNTTTSAWGLQDEAEIGDIVTFRTKVTDGIGTNQAITVYDKMDAGLTYQNSVTVYQSVASPKNIDKATYYEIGTGLTPALTTDEDVTTTGDTYYIKLTAAADTFAESHTGLSSVTSGSGTAGTPTFTVTLAENLVKGMNSGDTVYIYYTAKLNDRATLGTTANQNNAFLGYSQQTTIDRKVDVYTYEFDLTKSDDDVTKKKLLPGAEFVLYDEDPWDSVNGKVDTNKKTVKFLLDGTTYTAVDGIDDDDDKSPTLTSLSNSEITIKGLDHQTYWLVETKAPLGYNALKAPIRIDVGPLMESTTLVGSGVDAKEGVISGTSISYTMSGTLHTGKIGLNTTGGYFYSTGGVNVENTAGNELPSTGGMGTTVLYIVGGMLVILAGAYLFFSRKRTA